MAVFATVSLPGIGQLLFHALLDDVRLVSTELDERLHTLADYHASVSNEGHGVRGGRTSPHAGLLVRNLQEVTNSLFEGGIRTSRVQG